jgi:hypothetical protein
MHHMGDIMKGLIKIITAALVCSISINAHAALTPIEWSYAYVLVTKTHILPIKAVTEEVSQELAVTSEEFLDIVAEVLWERAEDRGVEREAKLRLWNLLYESDKPKYKKVLAETGLAAGDKTGRAQRVVKSILKDKKLDLNAPEIYQRGTVSLAALKQRYIDDARNAPIPNPKARPIAKLRKDQLAEDMFRSMGYPQGVDAVIVDIALVPTTPVSLSLYYRGQGAVVLEKYRIAQPKRKRPSDADDLWRVTKIVPDPLAYELDMPYMALTEGEADGDKRELYFNILLYGDVTGVRRLMQRYHHRGATAIAADPEILDVAAERLANEYKQVDEINADALAWICKTLALKGEGRYTTLLATIAQETQSEKLRRHAGSALKDSKSKEAVAQYEAGKTDFAVLKQKHPPIYALSTQGSEIQELEAETATGGEQGP